VSINTNSNLSSSWLPLFLCSVKKIEVTMTTIGNVIKDYLNSWIECDYCNDMCKVELIKSDCRDNPICNDCIDDYKWKGI